MNETGVVFSSDTDWVARRCHIGGRVPVNRVVARTSGGVPA